MTIAPWRTAEPIRRRKRRALAPVDLLVTAQRLAGSADSLPGMDDPCERCWRTIIANDQLEAWVVAWPVGGAIELHDHGNSGGAVVVARGTLTETSVRRGDDRTVCATSTSYRKRRACGVRSRIRSRLRQRRSGSGAQRPRLLSRPPIDDLFRLERTGWSGGSPHR